MNLLDTHVHVWNPNVLDYPWLTGLDALDRPFLPADIDRGNGLTDRMVFVQAGCRPGQSLDEVRWVAGFGADWPELSGIVAGADLRSDRLDAELDALCAAGPIVGIRHQLQGQPDALFTDDAFRHGLRRLGMRGLTFDACVTHDQLPALLDLLRAVPDVPVVLDHLGKPPVDAGIDSAAGGAWARSLDALAELPDVQVKLSGLAAEAGSRALLDANADAFVAHAFTAFSPRRSMIGSDWPVSARSAAGGDLASWVERVRDATGAEGDDWSALCGGTGELFYRLARVS